MPKLAKNYYRTAGNQKKVNCYMANIPKDIVNKAGIQENDEINIREEYGKIIIEKRYYYTCMECGYEWEDGKPYGSQSTCPRCGVGDLHCEDLREK